MKPKNLLHLLAKIFQITKLPWKFEAVDANQTAVALSPQDAAAHYNLVVTLKKLGRLDEPVKSYDQTIKLKPDLAVAHYNLGITLKN